jgi:hypothetical protein
MNRSLFWWSLTLGALTVSACGSDVTSPTDVATGGASGVDPKCYDACIAKGESPADCTASCADTKGDGGKTTSSGTSTSTSTTSSGTGGTGSSSSSSGIDPEVEKPCVQCWYDEADNGGPCEAEATACTYSLACTQLQWCPTMCEKPGCFEECNAIIPTGVAPLAALVQCSACNGGPCADECQGSVMLAYCN